MTLADLVSQLGAEMPLQVKRHDSVQMLRQAGVILRADGRGATRVALPRTPRLAPRVAIKRSA